MRALDHEDAYDEQDGGRRHRSEEERPVHEQILKALEGKNRTQAALIDAVKAQLEVR